MTPLEQAIEAVARALWDDLESLMEPERNAVFGEAAALVAQITPMLTGPLQAKLDAAEADKARAVEAERERCAVIAEGIDAEAFRARYDVTYTKKRFDQYSHEKGVNNALSIQAEDAAAAIRTGAKP